MKQRSEDNFKIEGSQEPAQSLLRMRILKLVFLAVATVAPVLFPVGARSQTEAPLYHYPAIYGNTSSIGYPRILAQVTDGNLSTTMQG
jgi:hypothetical protein